MQIPNGLTDFAGKRQWLGWGRVVRDGGKIGKVPVSGWQSGNKYIVYKASAANPNHWKTASEIQTLLESQDRELRGAPNDLGGMGIVLVDGLTGIDIDHCIDSEGNLSRLAQEILDTLGNTYAEVSPSGTGIHILALTDDSCNFDKCRNDSLGLEIYKALRLQDGTIQGARYFTVTGNAIKGHDVAPAERTGAVQALHAKYLSSAFSTPLETLPARSQAPQHNTHTTVLGNIDGGKLLRQILRDNPEDTKFRALAKGNNLGFASPSEADFSFCILLYQYLDQAEPDSLKNINRVEAIFKASRRLRETLLKNDGAYGTTLRRTVERAREAHEENKARKRGKLIENTNNIVPIPIQAPTEEPKEPFKHQYRVSEFAEYFSNDWETDRARLEEDLGTMTGYTNIDARQTEGLFPGLYALGASQAIGKSTFCLQMADQIAIQGRDVLYYSFELSKFDIANKCITRLIAIRRLEEALAEYAETKCSMEELLEETDLLTMKDVIKKYNNSAVKEAKTYYVKNIAPHLYPRELDIATAQDIQRDIKQFITDIKPKHKPVVIIDYLQLIEPPEGIKGTVKDALDKTLKTLKHFQRQQNLIMFVISSFNRAAELKPVATSSFKETGGIESTADVVAGLQLDTLNKDHTTERGYVNESEIAKAITRARAEIPRKINYVGLKNRRGEDRMELNFYYLQNCDLFIPLSNEESVGFIKCQDNVSTDGLSKTFAGAMEKKKELVPLLHNPYNAL